MSFDSKVLLMMALIGLFTIVHTIPSANKLCNLNCAKNRTRCLKCSSVANNTTTTQDYCHIRNPKVCARYRKHHSSFYEPCCPINPSKCYQFSLQCRKGRAQPVEFINECMSVSQNISCDICNSFTNCANIYEDCISKCLTATTTRSNGHGNQNNHQ